MPRQPSDEPLRKYTFNAWARDMDALSAMYGQDISSVIRQLIRAYIRRVEATQKGQQHE